MRASIRNAAASFAVVNRFIRWEPTRPAALGSYSSLPRQVARSTPLPASTGRYAQTFLQHAGAQLDGSIDPEDQATLDTLIGTNQAARTCLASVIVGSSQSRMADAL